MDWLKKYITKLNDLSISPRKEKPFKKIYLHNRRYFFSKDGYFHIKSTVL